MNGKILVIGIVSFFLLFFVYESWLMRGLPHKIKHNVQGVAEPLHDITAAHSIFIGTAAVYGINGQVPLICTNVSDDDVTINEGTLLAYLKPMDFGERVHKIITYESPINETHVSASTGSRKDHTYPRENNSKYARGVKRVSHQMNFTEGGKFSQKMSF